MQRCVLVENPNGTPQCCPVEGDDTPETFLTPGDLAAGFKFCGEVKVVYRHHNFPEAGKIPPHGRVTMHWLGGWAVVVPI